MTHLLLSSLTMAVSLQASAAMDDDLNCVILPDQQVDVSSPVPGVIRAVLVGRAEQVTGGQVIALMESSVEAATVSLANARESTDAEIQLRRVEHEYDAQHRDRLLALQVRQATSSQSLDDAQRVAEAAQLRVRLAEDRQREATLERKRADAMLALKTIRSPIDGVVVQRHKTVGEYVEAHPILSVARLNPLRVEVITPLALFGKVHEGMQMAIRAETDPEHERIATVTAVDAVADPGSGTFGLQLELPNPNLELPAGIKCSGRLLSEAESAALKPKQPPAYDNGQSAAVVPDDTGNSKPLETLASLAVSGDAPACLVSDPLPDKVQADALAQAAEDIGAVARLSEVSGARTIGYVVVTLPQEKPKHRRALAQRLREAGVVDILMFEHGDFSGSISVGTYNGPQSAERRRAELARLGFETQVRERTRTYTQWRVQVQLQASLTPQSASALLNHGAGEAASGFSSCGELRAAAL